MARNKGGGLQETHGGSFRFNGDLWPGLSQVGQPCSRRHSIYSTSCKGHGSKAVQSISHNMLGYLQSNPHIAINDDERARPGLSQVHFDRSRKCGTVYLRR